MNNNKAHRAYTVRNILDKKYKLFPFEEKWKDAFSQPEQSGVWFVWGNSGNGKTSFVLQLIKELSKYKRVLFNSLEEGLSFTLKEGLSNIGMQDVGRRLLIVSEPSPLLEQRLLKHKSPDIVIIDSFQYFQLSYKQYIEFKTKFPNKLLIFISHADGKNPSGRSAKSVMYDATLKIWVEGYRAFSKGRYIGEKGVYVIWEQGALKYGE